MEVFFASHDLTTKDQQGLYRGNSYRSILFYQNDAKKAFDMKNYDKAINIYNTSE